MTGHFEESAAGYTVEVSSSVVARGAPGLNDPYPSTHIEGFWKISVEYRYRCLEHPYISACISASAPGPTLEIAGILQSPLDKNNTGFALGPQEIDNNT
jgi:hypothetical protein